MLDYFLVFIIIALGCFIYLKDKEHNKQVNELIKALMAKSASDYREMKLADNTKIKIEPNKQMAQDLPINNDLPDYIPLNQATEKEWDEAIKHELEPKKTEDQSTGFFN